MDELRFDEVAVDAETPAAINRGIKDADKGRTVSLDEVRKLIPQWISKFESQKSSRIPTPSQSRF
jgi:predicted transcriptional regulator